MCVCVCVCVCLFPCLHIPIALAVVHDTYLISSETYIKNNHEQVALRVPSMLIRLDGSMTPSSYGDGTPTFGSLISAAQYPSSPPGIGTSAGATVTNYAAAAAATNPHLQQQHQQQYQQYQDCEPAGVQVMGYTGRNIDDDDDDDDYGGGSGDNDNDDGPDLLVKAAAGGPGLSAQQYVAQNWLTA